MTDGPALNVRFSQDSETTRIGSTIPQQPALSLEIAFRSTTEFGSLDRLTVFRGWIGADSEEVFYHARGLSDQMEAVIPLDLTDGGKRAFYLRVEAWTNGQSAFDKKQHFALSNPIWFTPA
jgi:hypothetical protein